MNKSHQLVRLGNIFQITSGGTPSRKDSAFFDNGEIPWFKTGDLKRRDLFESEEKITQEALDNSSAKLFPPNTVLVAMYGATIGACGILRVAGATNQACAAFLPNEKILPEYFYYFIHFNKHNFVRIGVGGAQPNISAEKLRNFKITLPSIKDQKRAVQIINKAESLLEKRRQTLRLADEFLKSAFLEMFGDPARNSKRLNVVSCGEIASHVSSGSTPFGGDKTYLKDGVLFIRSQNVLMNRLDLSDIAYISNEVHNKMKRTWVKKDDVLLNITGASIGRVAFFKGEDNTANVNQHVCIIRPDKNKVLPQYLSFLISMPSYQKTILGKNAGATRQAFNFDQIKRFQILLAPLSEQQKFADLVRKVEKLKEKQKQSETQLQNLFNSLMQRAFKGEPVYQNE